MTSSICGFSVTSVLCVFIAFRQECDDLIRRYFPTAPKRYRVFKRNKYVIKQQIVHPKMKKKTRGRHKISVVISLYFSFSNFLSGQTFLVNERNRSYKVVTGASNSIEIQSEAVPPHRTHAYTDF